MRTHIGRRWVTSWPVVLLSMGLVGLVLSGPALAKHEMGHDETSGICPQPRNTVTAPDEFLQLKNPLTPTPQNILAGKTLFQVDAKPSACRICHGISGNGLGILFHQVKPKPRNFTCVYTMEGIPDGQLFWIIKNGSPGTAMPSFSYLEDDQVWQLILYLSSFSKKE